MAFNQGFNQQNFKRGRDQGGSFGGDRGSKRFRADNDEPSSTIFLGNLAPDVSESQIAEAFGPCGQIKEIRLKRHEDTGKVKGFGFLEFATTEAAQRAVSLQNVTVLGRPTKVEMSSAARGAMGAPPPRAFDDRANFGNAGFNSNQSFSNGAGFGGNNFNQNFGGLASAATDILHNPFLQLKFQQIQQGLIASGLTGANGPVQNPGFNSFQSGNLGGSLSVLGNLGAPPSHNIPIGGDGPPMPVQQSRVTEPLRQKVDGSRTVFVGNLSDSVTDNTMFEIFGQCGELESIHWLNDKKSGKFKGCGFLTFYDDDATQAAVALNGTMVLGRPMRVDYAGDVGGGRPGPRRSEGRRGADRPVDHHQTPRPAGCTTLFVGNLPDSVDDSTIINLFGPMGTVLKEIRWLHDKNTGRFKGCGFVEFYDENATAEAAKLNGTMVHGKPVRVDFSQPRMTH